jgi:hypothetical protein
VSARSDGPASMARRGEGGERPGHGKDNTMAEEGRAQLRNVAPPAPRERDAGGAIALVLAGTGPVCGVRGSVVAGRALGGATGVLAWLTYYGSVDPTPVKAPRCSGLDTQPWRGGRKGVRAKKGI